MAFRHIVLYKLKPEHRAELPEILAGFRGLAGRIDGLIGIEAGADELRSERSFDVALVATFRDRAAYEAYLDHPLHGPVRERMHRVREASRSCDYETD